MLRVQSYLPAGTHADEPSGYVTLAHDQRHLRRKLLHLQNDEMVMLDLKEAVLFAHGDLLVVENGDLVEVRAANEKLFEITAKSPLHLIELAWHLGNRHLSAQIEEDRILILRDHVIRAMLEAWVQRCGMWKNPSNRPAAPIMRMVGIRMAAIPMGITGMAIMDTAATATTITIDA